MWPGETPRARPRGMGSRWRGASPGREPRPIRSSDQLARRPHHVVEIPMPERPQGSSPRTRAMGMAQGEVWARYHTGEANIEPHAATKPATTQAQRAPYLMHTASNAQLSPPRRRVTSPPRSPQRTPRLTLKVSPPRRRRISSPLRGQQRSPRQQQADFGASSRLVPRAHSLHQQVHAAEEDEEEEASEWQEESEDGIPNYTLQRPVAGARGRGATAGRLRQPHASSLAPVVMSRETKWPRDEVRPQRTARAVSQRAAIRRTGLEYDDETESDDEWVAEVQSVSDNLERGGSYSQSESLSGYLSDEDGRLPRMAETAEMCLQRLRRERGRTSKGGANSMLPSPAPEAVLESRPVARSPDAFRTQPEQPTGPEPEPEFEPEFNRTESFNLQGGHLMKARSETSTRNSDGTHQLMLTDSGQRARQQGASPTRTCRSPPRSPTLCGARPCSAGRRKDIDATVCCHPL